MESKLTLYIEKELTKKAKVYAKSKGRSLSDLVESYFKVLTVKSASADKDLTAKVRSLLGSVKVPGDFNYKNDLSNQLSKKHRQ